MMGSVYIGAYTDNRTSWSDLGFTVYRSRWPMSASYNPRLSIRANSWNFTVPLWMPLVLFTLPTAFFWSRDRRCVSKGHCRNCGYSLTGNTSGTCPECGTPI